MTSNAARALDEQARELTGADPAGLRFLSLHRAIADLLLAEMAQGGPSSADLTTLVDIIAAHRVAMLQVGLAAGPISRPIGDQLRQASEVLLQRLQTRLDADAAPQEVRDLLRRVAGINRLLADHLGSSHALEFGSQFAQRVREFAAVDALLLVVLTGYDEQPDSVQTLLPQLTELLDRVEAGLVQDPHDYLVPAIGAIGSTTDFESNPPFTGLPVDMLVKAAKLAFQHGELTTARSILHHGRQWYPGSAEVGELDAVLAPPTTQVQSAAPDAGFRRSQVWVADNADAYSGLWVAVVDGSLVCTGPTLRELLESADLGPDALITKVL